MYPITEDPELEELRVPRPQICFSNMRIKFSRPAQYNETFTFKVGNSLLPRETRLACHSSSWPAADGKL